MSNQGKKHRLSPKSKKQFEIFKKSKATSMSLIFVINDPKLSGSAKILFHLIIALAARTGHCFFTNSDLAAEAGISESAVKSSILALKEKGWISTEMITTSTGIRRRINVLYHMLRKDCPRKEECKEYIAGKFNRFAKERKNIHPDAIITYIVCAKYRQTMMSIRPCLYDSKLKPQIRILFQLISSLSVEKDYCYAGNLFLSKHLGVKKGSVSNYLTQLENEGLIRINYGMKRYIFLDFDQLKVRYLKKKKRLYED